MKDPAFLFYPGDWLSGTQYFTFEQKGAYLELLILQFNNYHFTEAQAKQVLSICNENVWDMIKLKFQTEQNNTFFFNERLRIEIEKRKKFTESRRLNALNTKKPDKKASAKHMDKHMENENENENKDLIKNENEKFMLENFEKARQLFPGTKRGLNTELENLKEKHKDWQQVIGLIEPAIQNQIYVRSIKTGFIPEWKNFQTWINQRCWEDEITIIEEKSDHTKKIEKWLQE